MLQILLEPREDYSIAEQAQMAIEGGATWLVLRSAGMEEPQIRELASELIPLCRENAIILTIESHIQLARELGLHGVLLSCGDDAGSVRIDFGAEAITGAETDNPKQILQYEKADIDYIVLRPLQPVDVIATVRKEGSLIPFVAMGNYTAAQARELLAQGFNGICTGDPVFSAPDPVACLKEYLVSIAQP